MRFPVFALVFLLPLLSLAQPLTPVSPTNWGLKIVVFTVGQADAAVFITPDGRTAISDMGEHFEDGKLIADFLLGAENGVGPISTVPYLFVSHYDSDHIGGASGLNGRITAQAAYDQGPSKKRDAKTTKTVYGKYVRYVGDLNGNGIQDGNEANFARNKAIAGRKFSLSGNTSIKILSVNGDTEGSCCDLPLDPSNKRIDENPGSVILLVSLGEFRYLTTGDASSDDWKREPDTEEALIHANALGGKRVSILKVSHHGSDTSSGKVFIESVLPQLAIISSDYKSIHRLPKLTTLKILEMNNAQVLVTGRATNPAGKYHQSKNKFDDGFKPKHTIDKVGSITILVAKDGSKFSVTTEKRPDVTVTSWSQN